MRSESSAEIWATRLVLAATSLFLAVPALAWWNGVPPLGDDASSHIVLYARVAEAIETGAGWWAPDFNLGFPIGLYYQPVPHFVGGVVTFLAGGGEAAVGVYKALTVLLVALWPWGVAAGGRALGMSRTAAAAAGVAAPLVTSVLGFGLTLRSSLILALHTQAWSAPLLPIVLGQVARALRGERRAWPWAVASWSLLALTHFFYGVATAAVALVWVLCQPRDVLGRFVRLAGLGVLVTIGLLFWLLPLLTTLEAMGGWPFGSSIRTEGYGLAGFLEPLLAGQLLDGESGWPVLSLLAAFGAALCFSRTDPESNAAWSRRFITAALVVAGLGGAVVAAYLATGMSVPVGLALLVAVAGLASLLVPMRALPERVPRLLLAFALVAGLFTIGRAGLGGVVDLFPFNRSVQMFRYVGLFHLAAVWLVGYGVGVVWARARAARRPAPRWLAAVAALALVVVPAGRGLGELTVAYRTLDDAEVDLAQYDGLVTALRGQTERNGAGRLFVHPSSGLYGHFHGALLGLWDASDAGQSYGVGLHDSLNFYFLEFFHPERAPNSRLLDLYGFQYIAASPLVDFADTGAVRVFRNPRYRLWRLDHRVPLCEPIAVGDEIDGFPRESRRAARAWLNGNGVARGVHPLLAIPEGLALGESTAAPVRVDETTNVEGTRGAAGELVLDQRSPSRLSCRVAMARDGAVLFKMGYHPFWRATVDGRPAELRYAFPAFSAVEVAEGLHDVVIEYRLPGYVPPLLALGLCVPIAVAAWGRRFAPRQTQEARARVNGRGPHHHHHHPPNSASRVRRDGRGLVGGD